MKPEVVWNLEEVYKLTAESLAAAKRARGQLYARVVEFFDTYDLLITPATVVAPFDIDIRAIDEVAGHKFANYFDWYTIAYAITATSLPALSLPCGFTANGLPVGLQIVGPPRGEAPLLGAAGLMEEVFGHATGLPIDPRPPD